jgi:hypothetical protein
MTAMKRLLLGFLIGVVAGASGYWYFQRGSTPASPESERGGVGGATDRVKSAVQRSVQDIRTEDIKRELERGGMVVREKFAKAGEAISDATADARTTAAIKAKLLKEPGLSSLSISVDTTDGLVTLSGTTQSHDEVAKAVKLALETEGVRKVVSTLQVKPAK